MDRILYGAMDESTARLAGVTMVAEPCPSHMSPVASHMGNKSIGSILALAWASCRRRKLDITTVAALHELHAKDDHLTPVKNAWLRLPSQSSGVTYNYFLILAGFQSVNPIAW